MTQWIRIDCDMAGHPKVAEYAYLMGMSEVAAFGALVRLFTWVKQYCPDGNIAKANPKSMVDAMGLDGMLCAPPEEGWEARAQVLCDGGLVEESYDSRMYVAQCELYKSHIRRMYGRIKVAYATHDATHEHFLLCAVMSLYLAGLVRGNGEVSGWAERQPNKGRKKAAGRSRQALSAHKRWGHTPEKPGGNCSICEWEFEHNPEWKAYANLKNSPTGDGTGDAHLEEGRTKPRTKDVQKMLSLQNNTKQNNTGGYMCSNEHITRSPSEPDQQPVDNPVDNSGVASPVESGTLFDHDPDQPSPTSPADSGAGRTCGPEGPDAEPGELAGGPAGTDGGKAAGRNLAGRGSEEPEGFQAFWDAYPRRNGRKDGKRDARRNWVKLSKTRQQQAVDALTEYKKAAGKYPVNASRYLGQDSDGQCFFEDYLEAQPMVDPTSPFNDNSDKRFGFDDEWGTW